MSIMDLTTGTSYGSIAAAINGSGAGDVIALSAGQYVEDLPLITHSLTIQGVGGLASITTPNPYPANGRAILYVAGDANANLTVSRLELSGARDAASNGAGILFEGGNNTLRVMDSWIHGNQDGILTGGVTAASTGGTHIIIERTELNHNGLALNDPRYGLDHNLYVGAATDLLIRDSLVHDNLGGHEIKSRAATNTVINNRIQDGPTATTSYSIDLPGGGTATVSGNVIQKGPAAENGSVIHFGGEGPAAPGSTLLVSNNTIISERAAGSVGVLNQAVDAGGMGGAVTITGNRFHGINEPLNNVANGPATLSGNTYEGVGAAPALDFSPPFATVPEPGTAALLPLALLAAAAFRRGSSRRSRSGPSRSGC